MARGRMVSATIGESRKFAALANDTHRMIYLMVLPHADKAGRVEADPVYIRSRCLMRLNVDLGIIQTWLEDAARVGLITFYEASGVPVLEIVDFLKHNTPHYKEPESELPAPEDGTPLYTQNSNVESTLNQRQVNVEPSLSQHQSNVGDKRREEKVIKEKKKEEKAPPQKSSSSKKKHSTIFPHIELPSNVPPGLWTEWLEHRVKLHPRLTESMVRAQLEQLEGLSAGEVRTVITHSLGGGYKNLFADRVRDGRRFNDAWTNPKPRSEPEYDTDMYVSHEHMVLAKKQNKTPEEEERLKEIVLKSFERVSVGAANRR